MADDDNPELSGFPYGELQNVAKSAEIDVSDQPGKEDLIERMTDAGIQFDGVTWVDDSGDPIPRRPVNQTSSTGPRDTTILYCLTRAETEAHIDEVRDALEEAGLELQTAGSDDDKYKIVSPASDVEEDSDRDEEDDSAGELEDLTKDELYEMASEEEIDGRSDMSKADLVEALSE